MACTALLRNDVGEVLHLALGAAECTDAALDELARTLVLQCEQGDEKSIVSNLRFSRLKQKHETGRKQAQRRGKEANRRRVLAEHTALPL